MLPVATASKTVLNPSPEKLAKGPKWSRVASLGAIGALLAGGLVCTAPAAGASTATETAAIQSVLSSLNSERAANGLPALAWSPALLASAHRHNLAMASANVLSHQVPGEATMGARISAAGVNWHYAAENIGYTTNRTTAGAVGLQQMMYNEKAPNDGHRVNILSRSSRYVGIDVAVGPNGKMWLTEDFSDATSAATGPTFVIPGHFNQNVPLRDIARSITSARQRTNPTAVELNLRALIGANPGLFGRGTALGGHRLYLPARLL
jgi:uncharacterized protein YkwD